eukprot:TRINITY_DN1865_c0_g1_i12.p3 TRINITY_DN1865_c0_g1~~TRINITY_DN1865_c0_g1_i12.p3  ORF type:complete len:232 (+),score=6.57 TRINITY_DN1865_c0_g1_i12:96-791(+)
MYTVLKMNYDQGPISFVCQDYNDMMRQSRFCGGTQLYDGVVTSQNSCCQQHPLMYPYLYNGQMQIQSFFNPAALIQYPTYIISYPWIPQQTHAPYQQDLQWIYSPQQFDYMHANFERRELSPRIRRSDNMLPTSHAYSQNISVNTQQQARKSKLWHKKRSKLSHIVCREVQGVDMEGDLGDGCVCVVCLEEFKVGEKIRQPRCKHVLHKTCADKWFQKKLACPICAMDLAP